MGLENIFSQENIQKYSDACIDLALSMADVKNNSFNFDTLVIPSRGAFPFFLGMTYALDKMQGMGEEISSFYKKLSIQPMLKPLMPKNCRLSTEHVDGGVNVLLIPFTADLSIKDRNDSTEVDDKRTTLYTGKTREYWARVTAAFFKDTSERMVDPYFRVFNEIVLQELEDRKEVSSSYENFPAINNFAMIDTVISGRASNEILRSFDIMAKERYDAASPDPDAIRPYAFLIVDDDGKKLKTPFKRFLQDRTKADFTKMLPIPNIVSEDTGSSLLGVSAVVYPSLMEISENFIYNGREFFVGAGSWHIQDSGDNLFHFNQFMDLIYSGVDSSLASEGSPVKEAFVRKRENYLKFAENIGLLGIEDTSLGCSNYLQSLNSNLGDSYLTGSNVLHVNFKEKLTRKIGRNICSFPGVSCRKDDLTTRFSK